eukprot:3291617-Rhodomonas_salina.2
MFAALNVDRVAEEHRGTREAIILSSFAPIEVQTHPNTAPEPSQARVGPRGSLFSPTPPPSQAPRGRRGSLSLRPKMGLAMQPNVENELAMQPNVEIEMSTCRQRIRGLQQQVSQLSVALAKCEKRHKAPK